MSDLRTLWDISEESFRALIETQLGRRHSMLPAEEVTAQEQVASLLGDSFIPSPDRIVMRAVEIDAPPRVVWPWLAQMMRGAGIYGWARLESPTCASAKHLISDLPPPRVGDRVGETFEIVAINPLREIVWLSCEPISVLGLLILRVSLNYCLCEREGNRSRLLVRQRCLLGQSADRIGRRFSNLLHFMLPASQLATIKRLAELHGDLDSHGNGHIHQAAPFRESAPSDDGFTAP